jgi:hypothetical protein
VPGFSSGSVNARTEQERATKARCPEGLDGSEACAGLDGLLASRARAAVDAPWVLGYGCAGGAIGKLLRHARGDGRVSGPAIPNRRAARIPLAVVRHRSLITGFRPASNLSEAAPGR